MQSIVPSQFPVSHETGKSLSSHIFRHAVHHHLAIFDPNVKAWETLAAGLQPGYEAIALHPHQDGVAQISGLLHSRRHIKTLHLVSHGEPDCLHLGSTRLSSDTLNRYRGFLQQWRHSLATDAEILIYGCNVAADSPSPFLQHLRQLTGANIAASANLTGHATLGGNWELQVRFGDGQFKHAFEPETLAAYPFTLASISSKTDFEDYLDTNSIATESKSVLTSIFNLFDDNETNPDTTPTANVELQGDKLTVGYLGNGLSLNALIPDVNGFELKNFTQSLNLNLPSIPISGQPSLIVENAKTDGSEAYELAIANFSAAQFIDNLAKSGNASLNPSVKNQIANIGGFDLSLSNGKIALNSSNNTTIQVADFFSDPQIKTALGKLNPQLVLSDLKFSYDNGTFSLASKIGQGSDIVEASTEFSGNNYQISIKNFNAGNFVTSLAEAARVTLDSSLKSKLTNIGKFDIDLSNNQVSLKSSDSEQIDLTQFFSDGSIKEFLGKIEPKLVLSDLAFNYEVPESGSARISLESEIGTGSNAVTVKMLLNGSEYELSLKNFAAGTLVSSLADAADIALNSTLENALKNVGKLDVFVSNDKVSLNSSEGETINLANFFSGSVKTALEKVEPKLLLSDFALNYEDKKLSVSSKIGKEDEQVDVAMNFGGGENKVSIQNFAAGNFITSLADAASITLNPSLKNAFNNLGKFDIDVSSDRISLKSSENEQIDISQFFESRSVKNFLNQLTPKLVLSDFVFDYQPKTNGSSLSLSSKIGQGDNKAEAAISFNGNDYEISVKNFPASDFISSLSAAAGVTLNSDLKAGLDKLENLDFVLSNEKVSVKSSGKLSLDISKIATIDTGVDTLDKAINSAVREALGDTELSLSNPEISYSFQNSSNRELNLAANIGSGSDRVSLAFNGKNARFEYDFNEDLGLSSLIGVETLEGLNLSDLKFILSNYKDSAKDLISGANFAGNFDFSKGDDVLSKFFRETLEIQKLDAKLQLGEALNLSAKANTNWSLIKDGEFQAILSEVGLGLELAKNKAKFGVEGLLKLTGYDSTQANEPELRLGGEVAINGNSLDAAFKLDADSGSWKNPFGLKGVELRDFGIQAGIGVSGFDNFGIRGDLKYGTIDLDAAFSVDVSNPNRTALVLTLNQPLSLVQLISGPVNPFIFGEGASQDSVLVDTFNLLDEVIDIQADSLKDEKDRDGDGDKEEKLPLIQFVPFEGVEIAGEVLKEGFGINAKVKAWGAEAKLQLAADTDFNKLEGSLALKNIDLGFLKIAGANDDELNLDVVIEPKAKQFNFKGDGRLELFGFTVAKADFDISQNSIHIKDLDIDLGIVGLDIDNLKVEIEDWSKLSGFKASGSGSVEVFGQELANAEFKIDEDLFYVSGGVGIEVLGYSLDVNVGIKLSDKTQVLELGANFLNTEYKTTLDISSISSGISSISDWVEDFVSDKILGSVGEAVELIGQGWNSVTEGVANAWNDVSRFFDNLSNSAGEFIRSIFDTDDDKWLGDGNDFYDGKGGNDYLRGRGGNDWLVGGDDNDILEGWQGNDRLEGNTGNDRLYGDEGNDQLEGGSGDDELHGRADNDLLYGHDGNDRLYGGDRDDKLEGGRGDDRLYGESGRDFLYGNEGQDELRGSSDSDLLDGGEGRDNLYGEGGSDRLYGGRQDDFLSGGDGNDELHGYLGRDTLHGDRGNDVLYGQQYGDILKGGDGNDVLYGEDNGKQGQRYDGSNDNDTLYGEGGNDFIFGGVGHDRLYSGSGNDILKGGDGNDVLYVDSSSGNNILNGGAGDDTLDAHNSDDVLKGGDGRDLLKGYGGDDLLQGGSGDDRLYGNGGKDQLQGDGGSDRLYGGSGNDILQGGDGNDELKGEAGDDELKGGNGNDTLYAAGGRDHLKGGDGNDRLIIQDNRPHRLDGEAGDDKLEGNSGADTLYSGAGNDRLDGRGGNDLIEGGDGNDDIFPEDGDDTVFGGPGRDRVYIDRGKNYVKGGDGDDDIRVGSITNDNQYFLGDAGNDQLQGKAGNDTLEGGDDHDRLSGERGNDWLDGGAGNDRLQGDFGDDTLAGGDGLDTIDGGSGSDFANYSDAPTGIDADLSKQTVRIGSTTERLSSIENIIGSHHNDSLSGNTQNSILNGNDGDDRIQSGRGNDTINGGQGNDTLVLEGQESDYRRIPLDNGWEIRGNNSVKIVSGIESFVYEKATSISNGPIAGATVFIDTNGNFQLDDDELQTTTDTTGQYSFGDFDFSSLDRNDDDTIDPAEGQIVAIGGTDITTGLPSVLPLISPIGDTAEPVVATTPLTTIKAVFASLDISEEDTEALLEKISGLSLDALGESFDDFDPYSDIGDGNQRGVVVAENHIKIANLLAHGQTLLEASGYAKSDSSIQAISALAEVLQNVDRFDLSNSDHLKQLYDRLIERPTNNLFEEFDSQGGVWKFDPDILPAGATFNNPYSNPMQAWSYIIPRYLENPVRSPGDHAIDAISDLVARSHDRLETLVKVGRESSVSDVLPSINPLKHAIYSDLRDVTEQLVRGDLTPEQSQTQVEAALDGDRFLVQYDLNENRTVRVTATETVTEGEDTTAQFVITLGEAAPNQGLKILYTLSGTATPGQDYSTDGGQFGEIDIEAGSVEGIINLSLLDDSQTEIPESVTLKLQYIGDGYTADPIHQTAVVEIADNDAGTADDENPGIEKTGSFDGDTLVGSPNDDVLSGEYGSDFLDGGDGDDQLFGGASDDTLNGGDGNDNLEGNFGDDLLHGNPGQDLLDGGAGDDTLHGGRDSDRLHGNAGADRLHGDSGNDYLAGGKGNDYLEGSQDNDWLVGQAGEDILEGGAGVDLLNGGDGADVFYFRVPSDGGDLILDFDPDSGDRIQISASGFEIDTLDDFSVLAGRLRFQGREIALLQNDGQTYNHFSNLDEILSLVDDPISQTAPEAIDLSIDWTPGVATSDLVANPETTQLDEIIDRGSIRLGTSSSSNLSFDIEFARTLAAALFGDADRIESIAAAGFTDSLTQVARGTVDLATRRSTHTLERDASLGIDFSPLYFYDRQAVLVRDNSGIDNIFDLQDRTIGVIEGTTTAQNLTTTLEELGVEFSTRRFTTTNEAVAAYDRGEIDAYSSDRALLGQRIASLSDPNNHRFLDVELSKEPIALALPENDSQWADVVRWVNYVPLQAEEFGINSQNIEQFIAINTDDNPNNDSSPAIRRFLGIEGELGATLGLPDNFAVNVIQQVGNYSEIFARHFPEMERDRNLLWTEGGLLYSPPFSGSELDLDLVENSDRDLVAEIQARGRLQVGINGNAPGFSNLQTDGQLVGFDVDLGRALAAAVFGDANAVDFVPQNTRDRFTNVANGVVDVSASQATNNLVRDASFGVDFGPTYLYTGQGVLTRKDSGISSVAMLSGRQVGVLENTTSPQNLQDALTELGGSFIPVVFPNKTDLLDAYDRGEVDAISNDLPLLSASIPTLSDPESHHLLDEVLSKEPLALVVDENQSQWADIVRWVSNALVQAEELGITASNIDRLLAENTDDTLENDANTPIRQFLGLEGNLGEILGLPADFAVQAVRAVGNYGEIYDRHFHADLLRRDANALSADFGLQYALPVGNIATSPNSDNLPAASQPPQDLTGSQGDDLLEGDARDNRLIGNGGNDTLQGGNGADWLSGVDVNASQPGQGEQDLLIGGDGADTFVLGDAQGVYYRNDGDSYARIADWQPGDVLQLHGNADAYQVVAASSDLPDSTAILYAPDDGEDNATTIAVLQGVAPTSLDAAAFSFV